MPSRLLRDGILDSDAVNSLSWPAEVFYRRLMSAVDDFGRFDGRTAVLRSRLYPLKIESVREADISRWIAECVKAGLIAIYDVNNKPYILFGKLGSPRAKDSKFPPPPAGFELQPFTDESTCKQTNADENGCLQTKTDAPYSSSDSGASTDTSASNPPTPQGGDEKNKPPRPRNLLFDAIADVTGRDPRIRKNATEIGRVAASIAKGEPPYTPDEVREFSSRFHELCPWAAEKGFGRPSPGIIEGHIALLRARSVSIPTGGPRGAATKRQSDDDYYAKQMESVFGNEVPR